MDKIQDSSAWLKNNKETLHECRPLNSELTKEQCQQTKRKYTELLKKGFIESKARYKKIYFCSSVCSGLCTSDAKRKIGESYEDKQASETES